MFQMIVEERFDVIGNEDGVLWSEFLGPELETACQSESAEREWTLSPRPR